MKTYKFLNQKLINFRNDPQKAIKKTINYWYRSFLDIYYLFVLRVNHPVTYRTLYTIRKGTALYGGAYKYVHLHKLLKLFNPRSILEFGSGSSTGVFATYSLSTEISIRTVEGSEFWLNNTKASLGSLASNIEFVLAPVISEKNYPNRCYYRYKNEINTSIDFVYVDGPPLVVDGQEDAEAVNWNVIELIDSGLYPEVIVVDGRKSTVRYIAENYSNKYTVFLRSEKTLFPGYRYHSFFVRIRNDK